jgi:hypothetical protein
MENCMARELPYGFDQPEQPTIQEHEHIEGDVLECQTLVAASSVLTPMLTINNNNIVEQGGKLYTYNFATHTLDATRIFLDGT